MATDRPSDVADSMIVSGLCLSIPENAVDYAHSMPPDKSHILPYITGTCESIYPRYIRNQYSIPNFLRNCYMYIFEFYLVNTCFTFYSS